MSIEAIKLRMEQVGLTRKALEAAIGSESRMSEILNRHRPLTLGMIRKLHARFGIPLENLLGEDETA
ncbi:MAG TPA: helix-turn-helix domain-containing protein [Stellaceae bacterium]|nr:helix-turn-helix domain-containing protein [Stellaceae bacterium]